VAGGDGGKQQYLRASTEASSSAAAPRFSVVRLPPRAVIPMLPFSGIRAGGLAVCGRRAFSVGRTYGGVGSSDPSYLCRRAATFEVFLRRPLYRRTRRPPAAAAASARQTTTTAIARPGRPASETCSMLAAATRYRNPIVNRRRPLSPPTIDRSRPVESSRVARAQSTDGTSKGRRPRLARAANEGVKLKRQKSRSGWKCNVM